MKELPTLAKKEQLLINLLITKLQVVVYSDFVDLFPTYSRSEIFNIQWTMKVKMFNSEKAACVLHIYSLRWCISVANFS